MKIKDIAAICKKSMSLIVTEPDANGVQYAGDQTGMFVLELPGMRVTPQALLNIMDVPPEKADAYMTEMYSCVVEDISETAPELPAGISPMFFEFQGAEYAAVTFSDKCVFVNTRYLKCMDAKSEVKVRRNSCGNYYLVIKHGIFVDAVIHPAEIDNATKSVNANFIQTLRALKDRAEHGLSDERAADPATGEVVL